MWCVFCSFCVSVCLFFGLQIQVLMDLCLWCGVCGCACVYARVCVLVCVLVCLCRQGGAGRCLCIPSPPHLTLVLPNVTEDTVEGVQEALLHRLGNVRCLFFVYCFFVRVFCCSCLRCLLFCCLCFFLVRVLVRVRVFFSVVYYCVFLGLLMSFT